MPCYHVTFKKKFFSISTLLMIFLALAGRPDTSFHSLLTTKTNNFNT